MTSKQEIWNSWTNRYIDTTTPIPLFETDESGKVAYKQYGADNRRILKRSEQMDHRIQQEGQQVLDDWEGGTDSYDGLIYLMYWLNDGEIVPLYIGKGESMGVMVKDSVPILLQRLENWKRDQNSISIIPLGKGRICRLLVSLLHQL